MVRPIFMWTVFVLSGCSDYSTLLECKVVEEQKGASVGSAIDYCNKLVEEGEIECDARWCSK